VILAERFFEAATAHTKIAILVMVVLTVAIGAGLPQVEQTSSLDEFQTESDVSEKLDYIGQNFTADDENTTRMQVILREGNVLSKENLLASLRFQQALRNDAAVNDTLASDQPTVGIANAIAVRSLVGEEVADVRRLGARIQRLNATIQAERRALEENRSALQDRRDDLNVTAGALRGAMTDLRENPGADVGPAFERVNADTPVDLTAEDAATFETAVTRLRDARNESEIEAAYALGTEGVLGEEFAALEQRGEALQERAAQLREDGERLGELAAQLEAEQEDIERVQSANLTTQIERIESMNGSELDATITSVLSADGGSNRAFRFMPTGYEAGSTEAEATTILVTQTTADASRAQGAASDRITDSQNIMLVGKDEIQFQIAETADDGSRLKQLEEEKAYNERFLQSVKKKLNNEGFVNNAKPEVVEKERQKKRDAEEKIRKLAENIARLDTTQDA